MKIVQLLQERTQFKKLQIKKTCFKCKKNYHTSICYQPRKSEIEDNEKDWSENSKTDDKNKKTSTMLTNSYQKQGNDFTASSRFTNNSVNTETDWSWSDLRYRKSMQLKCTCESKFTSSFELENHQNRRNINR